jgi:D-beta-D-heptose 7-phosphate kinase/D-beta-D-heptose 1-phosphate adenosyltransferase
LNTLKDYRSNFNKARILVIGDVMLDKWSYHTKTRISPEAPVPVVKEGDSLSELGGAGNALRHLNFLSNKSHELLTVVGDDQSGHALRQMANNSKFRVHWVEDKSRKTTTKERFFLDGDLVFRKDSEETQDISLQIDSEMTEILNNIVKNFDVILLSDYAKGVLSPNFVKHIREIASGKGIPIVVDPGLGRLHLYEGCTVIKPNLIEWDDYVASSGGEAEGLKLLFESGTQNVLVTQSSQGVRLIGPSVDTILAPREKIEVVDVTGAGDSLAAALSLLIGEGFPIGDCLEILNEIGASTVQQLNTQLPEKK